MILVDTNLLVYTVVRDSPFHDAARTWLNERLSGVAGVGLPWPSLLGFVRLASNPKVVEPPVPIREGWQRVKSWLEQPPAWIPVPTRRHAAFLEPLLVQEQASRIVPDAHLAALAIEHGLRLCTTDRDFARFPGLAWENPIAGS